MCKPPVLHVVAAEDTIRSYTYQADQNILKTQNAAALSKVKYF